MKKIYNLVEKITDQRKDKYYINITNFKKDCDLIIDEDYFISRYLNKDFLYYVHFKNNEIVKVCVYQKNVKGKLKKCKK